MSKDRNNQRRFAILKVKNWFDGEVKVESEMDFFGLENATNEWETFEATVDLDDANYMLVDIVTCEVIASKTAYIPSN